MLISPRQELSPCNKAVHKAREPGVNATEDLSECRNRFEVNDDTVKKKKVDNEI